MKPITHRVYEVLKGRKDYLKCTEIAELIEGNVKRGGVYGALDLVAKWDDVDMSIKKVGGINTYKMTVKENRIDHHSAINLIFAGRSSEIFNRVGV